MQEQKVRNQAQRGRDNCRQRGAMVSSSSELSQANECLREGHSGIPIYHKPEQNSFLFSPFFCCHNLEILFAMESMAIVKLAKGFFDGWFFRKNKKKEKPH